MFECSLPEIDRLDEPTEWIELEFVNRLGVKWFERAKLSRHHGNL
jgi:hypothetical protein